jgi:hypothetical protein
MPGEATVIVAGRRFDTGLPRARALVGRLEEGPNLNPNTGTNEFSQRDPDGYYITISALEAA